MKCLVRGPLFLGIDLDSGYLFSLSHEGSRDGPTWARVLKEAKNQGMEPKCVVKGSCIQ